MGSLFLRPERRKGGGGEAKATKASDDHVARYDGHAIRLAGGPPWLEPIEQASALARWLERFLAEAAAENVAVQPIVVLPGWWVERRGRAVVRVVNPGEIRGALDRRKALDDQQLRRVCHQLERLCRDVGF